jgi:hypothetical protein
MGGEGEREVRRDMERSQTNMFLVWMMPVH